MKFPFTNRRKWLIGTGAALILTATPSFALFGLGDIVFDLIQQLTTLQMQYNMVKTTSPISCSSSSGRRRSMPWRTSM
jgi:hypothetical protein